MEGIPKVLLDLMRKYGTLEQGKWSAREDFEYRYELNEGDGLFICLARFRQNLFVTGMTITDATLAAKVYANWIVPSELLAAVDTETFAKKN